MNETSPPANTFARISLFAAVLTLLSFCIGLAPFLVGSSIVCYPAAFLFGAIALASGAIALMQIRRSDEPGRGMALIGMILGGSTILVTLCAILLTLTLGAAFIVQLFNATPTSVPLSTPQAP